MPLAETVFRSKIASYCERETSTGLERHTNEDGAYPKAGGHTLRFVKYVELKSLFSRAFFQQNLRSSCSLGEIASTPSRCPAASGPGVMALVAASSSGPRSTPTSAPSRPDSGSKWELDLRVVVYLKSSKSWINDTSSFPTTIIAQKKRHSSCRGLRGRRRTEAN